MKKLLIFAVAIFVQPLFSAKEIELKFMLSPQQEAVFSAWIEKNAFCSGVLEQNETYFDHPQKSFFTVRNDGFKDSQGALRVRTENGVSTWCYKYTHRDPVTGWTVSRDEWEVGVTDPAVVKAILEGLGYVKAVEMNKLRTAYSYTDKQGVVYEIVTDVIPDIGTFHEIELKGFTGACDDGYESIKSLLAQIGLQKYTLIDRSYIHMKLNPGWEKRSDWGFVKEVSIEK